VSKCHIAEIGVDAGGNGVAGDGGGAGATRGPDVILAGLAAAGAVGAVLRYLVDRLVQGRVASDFPYGTLVINVSGSLVLGFLTGAALHHGLAAGWLTVLGTGLIGAYTTFSTFSLEAGMLIERQAYTQAVFYITGSALLSVAALFAGFWLMRAVYA